MKTDFFDYILASSSCYYVDGDSSFDDNLHEILRVLKSGGSFMANFPGFIRDGGNIPRSFILENCKRVEDDHVIIQNDIYGLRNGYKFKTFDSEESIRKYFEKEFTDISVGVCIDNYYGVQINQYIVTAKKK